MLLSAHPWISVTIVNSQMLWPTRA